ncbi:hypothetical protein [Sphingomonas pokkalii]|uniref:Uncharacterized protein n=1 Tax=Sphingomonas pokkalii TaxID=2175090 RepID=A0A2U0SHQ0_9SPHN|nr:hypothetical protein [Sphingomonas pokkalii]PVX30870.1 hypothetical protein DD559_17320 [Sphingomonas pokkalii]
MKQLWLAIGVALACAASPAAAQRDLRVEGAWTHTATGLVFPERIGGAARTRIHEYDAEGADVSAGYALRQGDQVAFITLYVYPATPERSCAANFEEMEKSVAQSYTDVQVTESGRWPSPSGHNADSGYHARFALTGPLEGKEQPLTSESYLFCPAGNAWLVAARASWARDADFSQAFADLLHGLQWPEKLDTPAPATAPAAQTAN